MYFNPYKFFAKLTLNNGEVVELQGSGSITESMVTQYQSSVVSAEIGELCTGISSYTFEHCSHLTSVTIPDSVTYIGGYAFKSCSQLTSVTIGSGVRNIGNNAFVSCSGLTSVTSLATTAPTIKSDTFQDVQTNGTLSVPSGSTGYDVWMGTGNYYLGKYSWTKVEQ